MNQHPIRKEYFITVPAVGTAGNDAETSVLIAPFNFTLESAEYVTPTAITGANTNTRKVSLINKGQSGAGTTEMAALQFDSGVNTVAFDAKPITRSGTAENLNGAEGDVISWKSLHIATGITDPGGLVKVVIANR